MFTVSLVHDHPYNGGTLIGVYATIEQAQAVVEAHNATHGEWALPYSCGEYDVEEAAL